MSNRYSGDWSEFPHGGCGVQYRNKVAGEASEDFNFAAVEDHAGELIEHTAADGCPVTRKQAESVLGWMARTEQAGEAHQARLAIRLLEWIGGAQVTRARHTGEGVPVTSYAMGDMRLGIRAAIAIRELLPWSKISGMTQEDIGSAFGIRRQTLARVIKSFRNSFSK